jgi:hypothetical protein
MVVTPLGLRVLITAKIKLSKTNEPSAKRWAHSSLKLEIKIPKEEPGVLPPALPLEFLSQAPGLYNPIPLSLWATFVKRLNGLIALDNSAIAL